LIGTFDQEEMDLFCPWIDREKVGLLQDKDGPVSYSNPAEEQE
jgi:hypothetical protein